MVKSGLLVSNQHKNECCCEVETSDEVYICKMCSALDNIPPNFSWYGKIPIIHKLRTFGCYI